MAWATAAAACGAAGAAGAGAGEGGGEAIAACNGKPMPRSGTRFLGERSYIVHVPTGYGDAAVPLVLNLHGYRATADIQQSYSQMDGKADAEGFVVVYPQGEGSPPAWNAGGCCGGATTDDVGFLAALLDALEEELCIDPRRVYVTGLSNGGFMSHRLACEMADRIAAAAPVAGTIAVDPCRPARPIPVLHIHGTADATVPYEGGWSKGARETMVEWAERNGCDPTSATTFQNGDSRCETWSGCEGGADVVLCTVEGGGHTWPGSFDVPALGYTTKDLVANDVIWTFFAAHPKP